MFLTPEVNSIFALRQVYGVKRLRIEITRGGKGQIYYADARVFNHRGPLAQRLIGWWWRWPWWGRYGFSVQRSFENNTVSCCFRPTEINRVQFVLRLNVRWENRVIRFKFNYAYTARTLCACTKQSENSFDVFGSLIARFHSSIKRFGFVNRSL